MNLKAQIQAALNDGTIIGAVTFSDGSVLAKGGKVKGKGGDSQAPVVVAPPPAAIVKPAVIATSGSLRLYADASIGSDDLDAYCAGYSGPGQLCYGLFLGDAEQVFPQINDDPALLANVEYNRAAVYGPLGMATATFGAGIQGCSAAFGDRSKGHVYAPGSIHAIRGTLALRADSVDIPRLLDTWKAQGYYPVQVEQGASGTAFA